jgi:hypothetical protein
MDSGQSSAISPGTHEMTLPRVSICMAVFNGGHYFQEALESALAQDYEILRNRRRQ